jgi:hypothetical protein
MGISQKTPFGISINNFVNRKIADFQQGLGQALPCHVIKVEGAIVTVSFDVLDTVNGVEITIPSITCPIAESAYVRLPVQVNDTGICVPANARLGAISGLGETTKPAPLTQPSNLGALVFVPIGSKNWAKTDPVDPDALNLNGKNGVVLRDRTNACVMTLTPTGVVTTIGGTTFTINGTGVTATNGASTIVMDASSINFTSPVINLNGVIGLNGPFTQHTNTYGTTGKLLGPVEFVNTVTADSSVIVGGAVNASGDVTAGAISLKTHKHGGVATGGAQTGVPV